MKNLINELRGEHAVILSKIDELEAAIQSGQPDVDGFLEFFEKYVEQRHHAKEEGLLFPKMRSDPFLSEMVDALLAEHEDERRMVEHLRAGGDPSSLLSVYVQNLRWHIAKENSMIFESAEHALTQ